MVDIDNDLVVFFSDLVDSTHINRVLFLRPRTTCETDLRVGITVSYASDASDSYTCTM